MGAFYFMTTVPVCPPSVVPWVLVLLSFGPALVPLQDPNLLVHHDQVGHNHHRLLVGGDLR